ncbi:MAG: energy-coupling factor transporter transmembrane protein EcfT [Anaerolineaceae bacterium]|nr:energy-coupling factor transporter transmembrane protein EcfT [Anaerolineaceae bacterium]
MLQFSYLPGESFFHRIDPVSKFAWLIAIAFIAYIVTTPLHQLVMAILIVICALLLAKLPARKFFAGFSVFMSFAVFLFILQLLFAPPENTRIYFEFGIIRISEASLRFAMNLGIRVINVGSSALIFTMTTEPARLVNSMITILRVPYRFAYAFYAALRYIPVFENEARNILNAHAVRGAGMDEGFLSKVRMVTRLTVPLLISGLRRAKNSAIAMEGRAFGAYPTKTIRVDYPVPRSGILFAVVWWLAFVAYFIYVLNTTGFIRT